MPINEKEFTAELSRIFKENSLSSLISREKSDMLFRLTVRMLEENEKYNLTAITEPSEIIAKHYADCALLSPKIKKGAKLIDVGCGAGFPTLPLAILRDDISILAMDSTAKRVSYVEKTASLLGLSNVRALTMRAEDGGREQELREAFDYATARAVANLRVLSELCIPFVKAGGEFIAMKGKNAPYELKEAKKAIATLGGSDARLEEALIKCDTGVEEHAFIIVKKKLKTPSLYPRPYAKISKAPL